MRSMGGRGARAVGAHLLAAIVTGCGVPITSGSTFGTGVDPSEPLTFSWNQDRDLVVGDLDWRPVSAIIRKGSDPGSDSYSGFRDNWSVAGERPSTGHAGYLREREVEDVFLCGLARDVCVKWTAEDAAREGFTAVFLWDLTRAVNPDDDERVRAELRAGGVEVLESMTLEGEVSG